MRQERIQVIDRGYEPSRGGYYFIIIGTPSGDSHKVEVTQEDYERIRVG